MDAGEPAFMNFEKPDFTKHGCGPASFTMDLQRVWPMERQGGLRGTMSEIGMGRRVEGRRGGDYAAIVR